VRREALSLELVVGHELDVESVAGRGDRLVVGVLTEMFQSRCDGVRPVVYRYVISAAAAVSHARHSVIKRTASAELRAKMYRAAVSLGAATAVIQASGVTRMGDTRGGK